MYSKEFDEGFIENPEIFAVNVLPAHASIKHFKSEEERSEGKYTSLRFYLNGKWNFLYAKNMKEAKSIDEIIEGSFEAWDLIDVPSHIQLQGYDVPHYTNTSYPWDGKEWVVPGEVPKLFNPVGTYEKSFIMPIDHYSQRIFISFQGVESGFALWLNGKFVGYSENSFSPSDFDITDFVKAGENSLIVRVWKWTSSSWCEDQDFFRFSGIFRDVYLYAVPSTHLYDVKVNAAVKVNTPPKDLGSTKNAGNLELECTVLGKGHIEAILYDSKAGVLSRSTKDIEARAVIASIATEINVSNREDDSAETIGKDCQYSKDHKDSKDGKDSKGYKDCFENSYDVFCVSLKFKEIINPKLWSAENPNLYYLKLLIYDKDNTLTQVVGMDVGFRSFEMDDGLMKLNGKRIVFKGVNRHEFSARKGRVPDYEAVLKDIITMKQNNINAIRTSHYPNDISIYELCDIFGLYVIDENNMETHGTMEAYDRGYVGEDYLLPGDKSEWRAMLLDRVNSTYQRDKNHPCVLIWSLGNESRGGSVINAMAELFRSLDSGRLVHYEGIFHDRSYPKSSDMESQMYTSVENIEKFLQEHPQKPFICCEYSHAMGNSCGGMHLYTELSEREDRYQGGFLWDYIDQALFLKDRYGREYLGYGGDFEDRPSDYEFSGNGIVYADTREASPKMQAVKYNYQNLRIHAQFEGFRVINNNLFTSTKEYECYINTCIEGVLELTETVKIEIEPGESGFIGWPKKTYDILNVCRINGRECSVVVSFCLQKDTLWGKAGHEVAFGEFISKPDNSVAVEKQAASDELCKLIFVRGNNNIGVKGNDFSVMFSKNSIGIVSYIYKGREMISFVPRPNFWRAPTNNDEGNMFAQRYGQWKLASMYVSTRSENRFEDASPEVVVKSDAISVSYLYHLPTTPKADCRVTYEVKADGMIEVCMLYNPVKELGDMPEFSMMFKLPADYDRIMWYGLGREETYADRLSGARLGIYENRVSDNFAKYLTPQECGNKCGVRWAKVFDEDGRGLYFEGEELCFSALNFTPHEIENAAHAYELPPVHSTVIRVGSAQMGVGGDDSWGARTLPQYLIDVSKAVELKFCFRGI